jgi:hypothetical protein
VSISQSGIQYGATSIDHEGVVYSLGSGGGGDGHGGGTNRPQPATTPLAIRVNAGECIEINLTNHLADPASLNLAQLPFDPQGSYGAAIGFNQDSTTPPGGSKVYRFYADRELGTTVFVDLADPSRVAHGAFGAVVVEPAGAVYRDSVSGAVLQSGVEASIITPQARFRELVTLFTDTDPIIGHNTMPYPTSVSGFTGINYAAESFAGRLLQNADPTLIFNSTAHGDPRQVVRAHAGDPFVFRVAEPWGEQAHVFSVEGHVFPLEPAMPGSEEVSARYLLPGYSLSAVITNGVGDPGDYLFLDHREPFLEAGLWGILRVLNPGDLGIKPLASF